MPTYQYRCKDCQYEFEEFQNITAEPIDKCPRCGGPAERVISGGAGLLFKGDGFYITDYRSSGYKNDAKKDKPPTSSDSKPASKPDSPPKKKSDP
jgi:putative FmdB family regulatory protein